VGAWAPAGRATITCVSEVGKGGAFLSCGLPAKFTATETTAAVPPCRLSAKRPLPAMTLPCCRWTNEIKTADLAQANAGPSGVTRVIACDSGQLGYRPPRAEHRFDAILDGYFHAGISGDFSKHGDFCQGEGPKWPTPRSWPSPAHACP